MDADIALEGEARRVYERYAVEFVERFGLCPWAVRARREGHVAVRVCLSPEPDTAAAVAIAAAVEAEAPIEVGLVLFPRLEIGRVVFERFVSEVRKEAGDALAMAAFHPDAQADTSDAARLVPFIRRTPDPTIQLVRMSVLEGVRRKEGDQGTGYVDLSKISPAQLAELAAEQPAVPLHDRVAEANLETIATLGVRDAEAVLSDIRADRERSYAALLV